MMMASSSGIMTLENFSIPFCTPLTITTCTSSMSMMPYSTGIHASPVKSEKKAL